MMLEYYFHMSSNIFTHIFCTVHDHIDRLVVQFLSKRVIPFGTVIEVDVRIKSLVLTLAEWASQFEVCAIAVQQSE